ncbi:MAG: hypothetical protein IRY91_16090 [Gemmatimonadaceae bacterium]|nr:hypothetical protein [Gemmatimonadaceae bacterium]
MLTYIRSTSGVAAAAGLALALGAPRAVAQTRFAWPDTTTHVGQYPRVEQCLTAVARARREALHREALTVWRDTTPSDPHFALEPEPAPVVQTAARCAARFAASSAPLEDFALLLRVYLAAGRDADASALVARRLAAVPANAPRERIAVSDSAVRLYLEARPERLDAAEQLLLARVRGGADRIERIELYARLMDAAEGAGDTARARRMARLTVAAADSLTPTERESEKYEKMNDGSGGDLLVFNAVQVLAGRATILDSLRHGTAALSALMRSMWASRTGERPEALPVPIGERAPAITADYWLPREASGAPHPAPGRVTLVEFLDHDYCVTADANGNVSDRCGQTLAKARRLSERFPALEVVIVTQTHGSFLYVAPPSPAEEAELARRWLDTYRIPRAVLAMTSSQFWKLPPPDARRIDKTMQNRTRYVFVNNAGGPPSNEFLIDQDGLIVSAFGRSETDLAQLIEVLLQRQPGGNRAAR